TACRKTGLWARFLGEGSPLAARGGGSSTMVSAASNLAKIKVRPRPSWTVCDPTGCAQGRPKLSSQGPLHSCFFWQLATGDWQLLLEFSKTAKARHSGMPEIMIGRHCPPGKSLISDEFWQLATAS